MSAPERCPCGSGSPFAGCCAPLLSGERQAQSAEQLMRSRFTAFAVGDAEYLMRTWHPSTRPERIDPDPDTRWLHLRVVAVQDGGPFHREGTVRFAAVYRDAAGRGELRELSRFRREGSWFYVDGDVDAPA